MDKFITLVGQLFLVAVIQLVVEVFIDPKSRPYHAMILNMACFMGSLYLLIDFIFNKMLVELSSVISLPFNLPF